MAQIGKKNKSLTCSDKVSALLEEYVYPFSLSVKIKYHFIFCLSLQIAGWDSPAGGGWEQHAEFQTGTYLIQMHNALSHFGGIFYSD